MAEFTDAGRFVWYDLMSPDTEASKRFYTKVLGWGTRADRPLFGIDGRPPYMMWTAAASPIAGLVPFNEAYWLGYVGVADVGRSVMQARDLGGDVVFEPHDIPEVGRFAVISDPEGATIALFQSVKGLPPSQPFTPEPLEFSWHELATTDPRAAFDFYAAMFGWQAITENQTGSLGARVVFGQRGVPYGGMVNKPRENPRTAWCYYVRVADVHQAANEVRHHGGQVTSGPAEASSGEWIAQCCDPCGGRFAVIDRPSANRA